jgi:hypothetical protein
LQDGDQDELEPEDKDREEKEKLDDVALGADDDKASGEGK